MTQTCTCSHLRIEHEGGKRNLDGLRVHDCMVDGCKCTKYHGTAESIKEIDSVIIDFVKNIAIAVLIGGVLLAVINYSFSSTLSQFVITSKETGLDHYNYTTGSNSGIFPTDKIDTTLYYNERLVGILAFVPDLIIFGGVLGYILWQLCKYEGRKRSLIMGDKK